MGKSEMSLNSLGLFFPPVEALTAHSARGNAWTSALTPPLRWPPAGALRGKPGGSLPGGQVRDEL